MEPVLLEALAKVSPADGALQVFHANGAIRRLARGSWRWSLALLRQLRTLRLQASDVSFNCAMTTAPWLWALHLLRAASGLATDALGYNSAMNACRGRWQRTLALLMQLGHVNLRATNISFNTAITGSGRWRVASELLAAMPAQDTVSHNAAISQADRWECAVELLGSMSHRALQPSVITFNASIKACESTWTWALQLLPGSPDAFGANGVLAASRSWRRALALGRSLAWRRLHLDQVGLSAAISCCEPVWPASIDLLHGSGFAPNEVASSAAVSGCEKGYQWARALGLVAWMRLLRLQPNTTGCNSAISACEKGFAWRWALQLLRGMVGAAVESTETTINSLCSACEKSSIWQAAIGLLPKLDALAPEHPMAFNAAMCACQKGGCSWKLIAQLLSALQRAHRFSVVSFDAALSAKGDWRWGCELLWQMQRLWGCTAFSYELLLPTLPRVMAQKLIAEVAEDVTLELVDDLRRTREG